jgi:hypothetical protein
MSFQGHNRDLESLSSLADAAKVVVEGKTNIYELVASLQDEDVKSFLKAAACAQREGKSHFMFNGKDYPVTIASDIAKKIADNKEKESEASIEEDEVDPVSLFDTIKGMGEAVRQGTTQENDDIAPETDTGVEGQEDVEVKDGEEEESEEPEVKKEALDPVGKEDDDVDNDGDTDDSDEYLKKKRDAIGKAMKDEDEEEDGVEESFDLALIGKLIAEGLDLDEGKMKELHALVSKGMKDPMKIAKELGLKPSKDSAAAISALIKGMK